MKIYKILFLFLISITLIFKSGYSQDNEYNNKRYYIKSAKIKFKISGNTSGTEEIYFDDWGKREVQITNALTETTFFGIKNKQEEQSMNILDNDISYHIDLKQKTGVKTLNAGITTMSALGNGKSPRNVGKEMLEQLGGEKIGEDTILGKNCEVWKALGSKLWIWKGITLKISSKILGIERTSEAVEIKTGIKIDDNKFKVPEGIKITDYTQ